MLLLLLHYFPHGLVDQPATQFIVIILIPAILKFLNSILLNRYRTARIDPDTPIIKREEALVIGITRLGIPPY